MSRSIKFVMAQVAQYVPSFFLTCLTCLHFLYVRALIFFVPYLSSFFVRALSAFIFYVLFVPLFYVPSFFYMLYVPPFFLRAIIAFIFLLAFILFIYMIIKLTQINELTYVCSSLLLLNSVIYQRLSSIFTSTKLVPYSA